MAAPLHRSMARHRWAFPCLVAACLAVLAAGCGRQALVDERNAYYVRGMHLREQKRHEEAAAAFHACLRLSPASAMAHLQLALLYEEPLADPLRCVYHYRCFLEMRPDDANAETVRQWLARAESRLAATLGAPRGSERQPSSTPTAAAATPASPPATPDRDHTTLLERIRELTSANAALRERLEQTLAHLRAPPANEPDPPARAPLPAARAAPTPPAAGAAPPSPTPTPAATPSTPRPAPGNQAEQLHQVKPGETLSGLSRHYYGHLRYWTQLRDHNHDVLQGKDALRVGMTLRIPPVEVLAKGSPRAEPKTP